MGEYIGLAQPKEGFTQTERFNFARFAEGPNYKAVNRNLVEKVFSLLPEKSIGIDVAMGHGMLARLESDLLAGTSKQHYQIGVDLDPYAITQAKAQIPDTQECRFTFLQGDARDLKNLLRWYVKPGKVDYTSIHDAIHEVRDDPKKAEILKSQVKMLRVGGLFSYNSAFTSKAAGREWGIWLREFMNVAETEGVTVSSYKGKDIDRMPVHPPEFYKGLIENSGLEVIHDELVEVRMSKEELEGISEYPPFVKGFTEALVFSHPVKMELGIDWMKQAIQPTLDRFKTDALLRRWHEIIAQKP